MSKTRDNFPEWRDEHQVFELNYHQSDNYRWHDDQFLPIWEQIFGGFVGLDPDHFQFDDIILDIGAGSRPAFSYFTRGVIASVEPLATQYLQIPEVAEYWPPAYRENLFDQPAEVVIQPLLGKCAYVNCWNCLDHVYDWRSVLLNMFFYAKPGGIISLCTDTKAHGAGHPGIDDPAEMIRMISENTTIDILEINYTTDVVRDVAIKMIKKGDSE